MTKWDTLDPDPARRDSMWVLGQAKAQRWQQVSPQGPADCCRGSPLKASRLHREYCVPLASFETPCLGAFQNKLWAWPCARQQPLTKAFSKGAPGTHKWGGPQGTTLTAASRVTAKDALSRAKLWTHKPSSLFRASDRIQSRAVAPDLTCEEMRVIVAAKLAVVQVGALALADCPWGTSGSRTERLQPAFPLKTSKR